MSQTREPVGGRNTTDQGYHADRQCKVAQPGHCQVHRPDPATTSSARTVRRQASRVRSIWNSLQGPRDHDHGEHHHADGQDQRTTLGRQRFTLLHPALHIPASAGTT